MCHSECAALMERQKVVEEKENEWRGVRATKDTLRARSTHSNRSHMPAGDVILFSVRDQSVEPDVAKIPRRGPARGDASVITLCKFHNYETGAS